jgi:hypothetical protein
VSLIYEIHHHAGRWLVRLCNEPYGEYLNSEQAHLDAVEAASEARARGHEVEVWDRAAKARVL